MYVLSIVMPLRERKVTIFVFHVDNNTFVLTIDKIKPATTAA